MRKDAREDGLAVLMHQQVRVLDRMLKARLVRWLIHMFPELVTLPLLEPEEEKGSGS